MIEEFEFVFSSFWRYLGVLVIIHVIKFGLSGYQKSLTTALNGFYGWMGKRFLAFRTRREAKKEKLLQKIKKEK